MWHLTNKIKWFSRTQIFKEVWSAWPLMWEHDLFKTSRFSFIRTIFLWEIRKYCHLSQTKTAILSQNRKCVVEWLNKAEKASNRSQDFHRPQKEDSGIRHSLTSERRTLAISIRGLVNLVETVSNLGKDPWTATTVLWVACYYAHY